MAELSTVFNVTGGGTTCTGTGFAVGYRMHRQVLHTSSLNNQILQYASVNILPGLHFIRYKTGAGVYTVMASNPTNGLCGPPMSGSELLFQEHRNFLDSYGGRQHCKWCRSGQSDIKTPRACHLSIAIEWF